MAAKLSEGDTIAMQGEVTIVHDDGIWQGTMTLPKSLPQSLRGSEAVGLFCPEKVPLLTGTPSRRPNQARV